MAETRQRSELDRLAEALVQHLVDNPTRYAWAQEMRWTRDVDPQCELILRFTAPEPCEFCGDGPCPNGCEEADRG